VTKNEKLKCKCLRKNMRIKKLIITGLTSLSLVISILAGGFTGTMCYLGPQPCNYAGPTIAGKYGPSSGNGHVEVVSCGTTPIYGVDCGAGVDVAQVVKE
jgi:hypothetical protein